MALKADFELEHTFLKDAYIRIKKIILADGIHERYEEQENGEFHLKYDKYFECGAIVYVYPDAEARERNVMPTHQFGIEFGYDPNETDAPIYQVAYDALKKAERFVDVDVSDV